MTSSPPRPGHLISVRSHVTLADRIPPELHETVATALTNDGYPFNQMRSYKAGYLADLRTDDVLRGAGIVQLGLDRNLVVRAHDDGKAVVELDVYEEVVARRLAEPDDVQERWLARAFDDAEAVVDLHRSALRAWRAGDADGVEAALVAVDDPVLRTSWERLVGQRNQSLVDHVVASLSRPGTSVVVLDAERFGGAGGLLARLAVDGVAWKQVPGTPAASREPVPEPERGGPGAPCYLWKAKRGPTTVYLLGAVHSVNEAFYPLPAAVRQAYAAADRIAVEFDPSQLSPYQRGEYLDAYVYYNDGSTLEDHVSPEVFTRAKQHFAVHGLPFDTTRKARAHASSVKTASRDRAGFTHPGIDRHFLERAHAEGKEIVELETFQLRRGPGAGR